jgi:hypothetical protein
MHRTYHLQSRLQRLQQCCLVQVIWVTRKADLAVTCTHHTMTYHPKTPRKPLCILCHLPMSQLMSRRHHQRDQAYYHCPIDSQKRHVLVSLLLEDAEPSTCLTVTSSLVSVAWCQCLWVIPSGKVPPNLAS